MKIVLITTHYFESARRAGFHWLAEAYAREGHEVTFMTTSLSWLSWLRKDHRFAYPVRSEANQLKRLERGIQSFVWFTSWHPANLRIDVLNRASHRLFQRYGDLSLGLGEELLREADCVVFESCPGILLFDRVKRLNAHARLVYRVSDDVRLLGNHPVVIRTEERISPDFDLVSVPSPHMQRLFPRSRVQVHYHGVRADLFDEPSVSPYDGDWDAHLVFVGVAHLDHDFVRRASVLFPRCAFHIIGPLAGVPHADNVFVYGEMPFRETVRYIKHADVGLHTLAYTPGAESFTHSLKVLQYIYCRLPIVAPDYLDMGRAQVSSYAPGDDASIKKAIARALAMEHEMCTREGAHSWSDLAALLMEA